MQSLFTWSLLARLIQNSQQDICESGHDPLSVKIRDKSVRFLLFTSEKKGGLPVRVTIYSDVTMQLFKYEF